MEYQALTLLPWITGTFWVTAAVIVFLLIFGRKLTGPINGMLDGRAAGIQAALEEAAQLKAEAQAMLTDAMRRQEQAIADARQILAAAHAEAQRMSEALTKEAEATARRRKQMAEDRIAAAEKAALHDVSNIAVDVATAAVTQLLRNGFGADRQDGMIDHAIAGVPAALHRAV